MIIDDQNSNLLRRIHRSYLNDSLGTPTNHKPELSFPTGSKGLGKPGPLGPCSLYQPSISLAGAETFHHVPAWFARRRAVLLARLRHRDASRLLGAQLGDRKCQRMEDLSDGTDKPLAALGGSYSYNHRGNLLAGLRRAEIVRVFSPGPRDRGTLPSGSRRLLDRFEDVW